MGNRAVIAYIPDHQEVPATYEDAVKAGVAGIYLHWNGGPESVHAFLRAAKHYEFRTCDYGLARLTQVIGNYFDGPDGLSLGVGPIQNLDCDNYNNGTYVVHKWDVVDRWFGGGKNEKYDRAHSDAIYTEVRVSNDRIFGNTSEDAKVREALKRFDAAMMQAEAERADEDAWAQLTPIQKFLQVLNTL